jgi:hypothetical protein
MLNKYAVDSLESMLKHDTNYEFIKLSQEEHTFIYNKCADIPVPKVTNEIVYNDIYDKVEEILNECLFDLGYEWIDNDYRFIKNNVNINTNKED